MNLRERKYRTCFFFLFLLRRLKVKLPKIWFEMGLQPSYGMQPVLHFSCIHKDLFCDKLRTDGILHSGECRLVGKSNQITWFSLNEIARKFDCLPVWRFIAVALFVLQITKSKRKFQCFHAQQLIYELTNHYYHYNGIFDSFRMLWLKRMGGIGIWMTSCLTASGWKRENE